MAKEIKAFITNDSFIDNQQSTISPIYEISDIALSYSRNKQIYYSTDDPLYSLYVFKVNGLTYLTQTEVNSIINVVKSFSVFLTTTQITNKQQIILSFTNQFNTNNQSTPLSNLTYNNTIDSNSIRAVDYTSFTISDVSCEIWLSDNIFRTFYPDYEISIILPFTNFTTIVNNVSEFLTALDNFNLIEFNTRIEEDKDNYPTTYTRIINIPYRAPNSSTYKNCYFAFNIYGIQGNYDYILKLELYNYLTATLGLTSTLVEEIFPSILNINEFFITPRWDKIAIPSQVGQASINSQIMSAYNEVFDLNKYIKIYTDINYLKNNTYAVPFDYNNIMLFITNGYYTESSIKDFKQYFSDFITVTSTQQDFARMSLRTQKFVTLLENMLAVSNCNNSTELFNNLIANNNYNFTIINRAGVTYLSNLYDKHQIYVIPKYQFIELT